jgi:hypothetical protein
MAFIRVKTRKKSETERYEYAYLVENSWHKKMKQPKQAVKQYLGRVLRSDRRPIEFFDYIKAASKEEYLKKGFEAILTDLIRWECYQHNITTAQIDFENGRVRQNGRMVVIAMNQGFLCDYTLRSLALAGAGKQPEDTPGYNLAKALVEAGIQTPKEVFVGLYEKCAGVRAQDGQSHL